MTSDLPASPTPGSPEPQEQESVETILRSIRDLMIHPGEEAAPADMPVQEGALSASAAPLSPAADILELTERVYEEDEEEAPLEPVSATAAPAAPSFDILSQIDAALSPEPEVPEAVEVPLERQAAPAPTMAAPPPLPEPAPVPVPSFVAPAVASLAALPATPIPEPVSLDGVFEQATHALVERWMAVHLPPLVERLVEEALAARTTT